MPCTEEGSLKEEIVHLAKVRKRRRGLFALKVFTAL